MKNTIQIKSRWNSDIILYTGDGESLKEVLLNALSSEANLREANLYGADLREANLYGANLRGADLREANLYEANLYEANLYGADLREANLYEANLYGADLRGADLREANLYEANLYGADLREANLYEANLYGADLREANLYGANLREANLREANLYGANLREAILYEANLYGADLRGADLREANLYRANLYGANLREAKNFNKYLTTPLYTLLDQAEPIRAYKLVNSNGEGPMNGGVKYEVGKRVVDKNFNDDEHVQCGAGLNLASLDWVLRSYREGYKILICEFNKTTENGEPNICIPVASDGKFRVRELTVVAEKDLKEVGLK